MKNLALTLKSLWLKLPDSVRRMVHTFYQAFLAVFLIGISPVMSAVLNHNYADAKVALFALIAAAAAAAFSAVKGMIISYLQ